MLKLESRLSEEACFVAWNFSSSNLTPTQLHSNSHLFGKLVCCEHVPEEVLIKDIARQFADAELMPKVHLQTMNMVRGLLQFSIKVERPSGVASVTACMLLSDFQVCVHKEELSSCALVSDPWIDASRGGVHSGFQKALSSTKTLAAEVLVSFLLSFEALNLQTRDT